MIVLFISSCKNDKELVIEPIDQNLNPTDSLLLKSSKNIISIDAFEYFQISDYESYSKKELLEKLNGFVKENYAVKYKINRYNTYTILFYKKSFFINYKNEINKDRIDPEFGFFSDYKNMQIAMIYFNKINNSNNYLLSSVLYDKDSILIEKVDTIKLKNKGMNIQIKTAN